jgi:hypothetical protein
LDEGVRVLIIILQIAADSAIGLERNDIENFKKYVSSNHPGLRIIPKMRHLLLISSNFSITEPPQTKYSAG